MPPWCGVPLSVPHRGSGTILILDDEDSLREVMSIQLTALGYLVIEAADGAMALERARVLTTSSGTP